MNEFFLWSQEAKFINALDFLSLTEVDRNGTETRREAHVIN